MYNYNGISLKIIILSVFIGIIVSVLYLIVEHRNNDKNNLISQVDMMLSKIVDIPYTDMQMYIGNDKIASTNFTEEYKLVVYYDSLQCTSCAIDHIYNWEPTLDSLQRMNKKTAIVFIFSPSSMELNKFKNRILNSTFDYPVFMDTCNIFRKHNGFLPDNPRLHVFLLNRENRIISIGNPLDNHNVSDWH